MFCLLTAALPAQAQDSSLQGLDRLSNASAWTAVGRLDSRGGGFCTATLIAPDLVLTAAHCTFNKTTKQPVAATDLVFRAGFRKGITYAIRRVAQVARPTNYDYQSTGNANSIRHDVALLRLARPVSGHLIEPFGVEPSRVTSGNVSVVSYGEGRANLPSLQRDCNVLGDKSGVMVMDCDVTFGSSGAPVFRVIGDEARIVSVVSGTAKISGKKRSVGMTLPVIVNALTKQLDSVSAPIETTRRVRVGSGRRAKGAKFVKPNGS